MQWRQLAVVGLALAAAATTASGQTKPRHVGLTLGIGAAQGKLRLSCSGCTFPVKEGGLSATFQAGWSLSDALILIGDGQIYSKKQQDNHGDDANSSYQMGAAEVLWYPSRRWEHFFKFGGGISHTKMKVDVSSLGLRDIASTGPVIRMGFGTDLRFGRTWSITPFIDYSLGPAANSNVQGLQVKASMLMFGAGFTWH